MACVLVVTRDNENLLFPVIMTLWNSYDCVYTYICSSSNNIKIERLGFDLVPFVMLLGKLHPCLCLAAVRVELLCGPSFVPHICIYSCV